MTELDNWQNNYIPYTPVQYGYEYMKLYPDGTLERHIPGASNYGQRSFDWRVTGAVMMNNFNRTVRQYTLEHVLYEDIPWWWKNGKQRVHVTDYDHGSGRVWMSPTHIIGKMPRPDLLTPPEAWHKVLVCYGNQPVQVTGPFLLQGGGMNWVINWNTYEYHKEPLNDPFEEGTTHTVMTTVPHSDTLVGYPTGGFRVTRPQFEFIRAGSLDQLIRMTINPNLKLEERSEPLP